MDDMSSLQELRTREVFCESLDVVREKEKFTRIG